MAKMEKTDREGIRIYWAQVKGTDQKEAVYYARIKVDGRAVDIKIGSKRDGVTEARAEKMRKKYLSGELPLPQVARKQRIKARAREKQALESRMTYGKIWELWLKEKGDYNRITNDTTHWNWRLKPVFENLTPGQLKPQILIDFRGDLKSAKTIPIGPYTQLLIAEKGGDKAAIAAAKKRFEAKQKPLSYATQYQVMTLLRRLTIWAIDRQLHKPVWIKWDIKQPKGKASDNLSKKQINKLIDVCQKSRHAVGSMVLLALYTGARRKEVVNLKWSDIEFETNTIRLGVNLKTGTTKDGENENRVPMNSFARAVLKRLPKISKTWVFPSPYSGQPYNNISKPLAALKQAADLPDGFRIMHGCRHVFGTTAGTLSNSMAVKNLLHHKEMVTSEKYVHLPADHLHGVSEKVAASFHQGGALDDDGAPQDGGADVIDIDQKRAG